MRIYLAKDAGYCFGVRDAVKLAYDSVWARATERMTDKGDAEDVAKLRSLYAPD